MVENVRFGPAGNDEAFLKKYKSIEQMPDYLEEMGLNAYEYQCGHGVRVSTGQCEKIKEAFDKKNIFLSLHAPYYISMSSIEEEKRKNSIGYIIASVKACLAMGGRRVVFHSGSCAKMPREDALELAADTFRGMVEELKNQELYGNILICPETMGKINQLGTEEETAYLCSLDEYALPCIDFGHVNARYGGSLKTTKDYEKVLNVFENKIGKDKMKFFHCHFSRIEFSAGGEKKHLTFEDNVYGPFFEPLAEVIYKKGYEPIIICESAGTQAADAKHMKESLSAAASL